jgi:hypothetical protein
MPSSFQTEMFSVPPVFSNLLEFTHTALSTWNTNFIYENSALPSMSIPNATH